MSVWSKFAFPVIAMLVAAATLTAGLVQFEEEARDLAFWVSLLPIMLAEGMLGLSLAGIGGDRGFPFFRIGSGMAATTYLGFTLFMLIPFYRSTSAQTLIILQLVGLLVWVILQLLIWLAEHDGRNGSSFAATGCNKTGFSLEAASLLAELKSRYPEQTELIRESGRVAEAARFCAESVRGSGQVDEKICDRLQHLRAGSGELPPEQMLTQLQELRDLFRQREETIRNLD